MTARRIKETDGFVPDCQVSQYGIYTIVSLQGKLQIAKPAESKIRSSNAKNTPTGRTLIPDCKNEHAASSMNYYCILPQYQ
jgi:hypothetical protein